MNSILIDTATGDLMVEHGSLVIGNTDSQVSELVLVSMRGELKEYPLIGGEVRNLLNGTPDQLWKGQVKKMLQTCGVAVNTITIADGTVTIK